MKLIVRHFFVLTLIFTGCFAYHGHRVKIFDENTDVLDAFTANLEADKQEIRAEGLMSQPNFLVSLLQIPVSIPLLYLYNLGYSVNFQNHSGHFG